MIIKEVSVLASQLDELRCLGNQFFATQSYGEAVDLYAICISECLEGLAVGSGHGHDVELEMPVREAADVRVVPEDDHTEKFRQWRMFPHVDKLSSRNERPKSPKGKAGAATCSVSVEEKYEKLVSPKSFPIWSTTSPLNVSPDHKDDRDERCTPRIIKSYADLPKVEVHPPNLQAYSQKTLPELGVDLGEDDIIESSESDKGMEAPQSDNGEDSDHEDEIDYYRGDKKLKAPEDDDEEMLLSVDHGEDEIQYSKSDEKTFKGPLDGDEEIPLPAVHGEDEIKHYKLYRHLMKPPITHERDDTNLRSRAPKYRWKDDSELSKLSEPLSMDVENKSTKDCKKIKPPKRSPLPSLPSPLLPRAPCDGTEFFAANRYDAFRRCILSQMYTDAKFPPPSEDKSDEETDLAEEDIEEEFGTEILPESEPPVSTSNLQAGVRTEEESKSPPDATIPSPTLSTAGAVKILIEKLRSVKVATVATNSRSAQEKGVEDDHVSTDAEDIRNTLLLAWSNRAEAWLRLENYDNAWDDAEKALELKSTHLKSLIRKAKALEGLEMCEEASLCYLDALREAPYIDSVREPIKQAIKRTKIRFQESMTGIYDISELCNAAGPSDTSPRFFSFFSTSCV